jgi:transposase
MAYDNKFRERVIAYMDKGHSYRKTSELFGIDSKTILRWRKLRHETGELKDRPREEWHKKIAPEKLLAYYEENPDSYLSEAAEAFGCSINAIFKAKKRLGITRKKN